MGHVKNIQKHQKNKIKENMSRTHSRWKTLKEVIPEKDKTPREIKVNNKVITSAEEIANEYTKFLDNKIEKIREEVKFENFKALRIFRSVINRVDNDAKFETVKVKEV